MKVIKVGLLGMGTVGSGVFEVLKNNAAEISRRAGCTIQIGRVVVRDPEEVRKLVGPDIPLSSDPFDIVNDSAIDVLVEVMGGTTLARDVVLAAIAKGKQVVTANKALLAVHGNEIFARAREAGVMVAFEAAVAGGIPIVKALREGLSANRVQMVAGIINGTTNFILDAMDSTGASYDDMFAEAQRLGYVEADPSADIDGHDAASKAAILASLAFHTRVTSDDVYCEGISNISATDIKAAQSAGYTIKLLAICERLIDDNGQETVSARVHPTLVPRSHPLASVDKSFNAIFIEAEAAGRLMFYGNGAGGAPTASAVLGDIVGAARNKVHGGRAPGESTYASLPIADFGDVETRYHIDMEVDDRIGVLAETAAVFSDRGISLRTVRQEEGGEDHARLVIVTHKAKESDLAATIESLNNLPAVKAVNSVIRLEGE